MSMVGFTYRDAQRISGAVQWSERERGTLHQDISSGSLRPQESWVKTPASLPGGYDGSTALQGKIVFRLDDGTDYELDPCWIKDPNGKALEAGKVYRGTFNQILTQGGDAYPLFLVQAGGSSSSLWPNACTVAPWRWESVYTDVDGTPTEYGKYLIHVRVTDIGDWDEGDHWNFTSHETLDFFMFDSWSGTSCLPILSMNNNSIPSTMLASFGSRSDLEDMTADWCQRNIRCHGARVTELFNEQSTLYFVNSANSHKIYPKTVKDSTTNTPVYPTYNIRPVIYNNSFSLTMISGQKYAVYTQAGYNSSGTSKTYYEFYPDPFNLLGSVTEGAVVSASGNTWIEPISTYAGTTWTGPSVGGQGLARYVVGRR